MSGEYEASSIQVLEGLEAVRRRPAMYIGSIDENGLHHLVWEIVDNSIDEAMAGACDRIIVMLDQTEHGFESVTVQDNGRGIPTEPHPHYNMSSLELVTTRLHSGGKFDHESYIFMSSCIHTVRRTTAFDTRVVGHWGYIKKKNRKEASGDHSTSSIK